MELSKVPTSSRQQYYPVILVDPPSPISHLTTPSPIHRSWSWHGKCAVPTGLSQKWGSRQAYLLTLLDVVVLPDTGARDEHDFELLLMPAIDEGGRGAKSVHERKQEWPAWGPERSLGTSGRGSKTVSTPLSLSVFDVCPLLLSSQGTHEYPRVAVSV